MSDSNRPFTLAHVTHEAVEQLGGIGTVLEGLMVSPVYQKHVKRSILVGPTATHISLDPEKRLGEHGEVLYSSVDNIDRVQLGGRFRPVEWAFNVAIVYGKRRYEPPGQARTGEAEVLLIDVFRTNPDRLSVFKLRLWETFGLNSARYENDWDYEEYVRIAEPAHYALLALLNDDDLPCVMIGHEYMGMPACLAAILDGQDQFRTVFHAHECATARLLVEGHPGHDAMFYNVLDQARGQSLYVEDVFGDLNASLRHALVSRAYLCDGVIAVGDRTRDELQFLNRSFAEQPIDLVYNGLPMITVDLKQKLDSRSMLAEYSKQLLGFEPDVMMTHVTRPVISKGLWRDLKVCHELDRRLGDLGRKGVLYILTSAAGVRRAQDAIVMERNFSWPRSHRRGYPDLVGPEIDINEMIEPFNATHGNVQVVLVNQFGWSRDRIGTRLPKEMNIADLRRATDVELGMATYEPFGISPLEPLGCGAICVVSNVCGCDGFVRHVTNGHKTPNVICGNFTTLSRPYSIDELKELGQADRDSVEATEAVKVADQIMSRLPTDQAQRQQLLESGQRLVSKMGWDQVVEDPLLPMLDRICRNGQ